MKKAKPTVVNIGISNWQNRVEKSTCLKCGKPIWILKYWGLNYPLEPDKSGSKIFGILHECKKDNRRNGYV